MKSAGILFIFIGIVVVYLTTTGKLVPLWDAIKTGLEQR